MDPVYHGRPQQRLNEEDDGRQRREALNGVLSSAARPLDATSPTQSDFPSTSTAVAPPSPYSSSNGAASTALPRPSSSSLSNNPYHRLSPTPTQPSIVAGAPRSPSLSSTTANSIPHPAFKASPREKTSSNYYDPTSDSADRQASDATWQSTAVQTPQKTQDSINIYASTHPESAGHYSGARSPRNATFSDPRSPTTHSHSHPSARGSSIPRSPHMATATSPVTSQNGSVNHAAVPATPSTPSSESKQNRANPMSFSSILADAAPAAAPPADQPTDTPAEAPVEAPAEPASKPTPKAASKLGSKASSTGPNTKPNPDFLPASKHPRKSSSRTSNADEAAPRASSRRYFSAKADTPSARTGSKRQSNGQTKLRNPSAEREKSIQGQMMKIDDDASDLDTSEFESEKQRYKAQSLKRKLEIDEYESSKQKIRRKHFIGEMATKLLRHVQAGEQRYREIHIEEAVTLVQQKEVEAEKERKKDMQRKRRREKTVATNLEQKDALLAKAEAAEDEAEKAKLLREAMRAEKKAIATRIILARGDKGPDLRTVSPLEPNFQGGTMSTFSADTDSSKPKGKGRGGARLRKSKEQKQAEKDSAEAAQAAIDAGEALPTLTTSQEPKLKLKFSTKEAKAAKETPEAQDKENKEPEEAKEESPAAVEPYVSKGYNQIYDQIWRDLGRKDVTKVYKLASDSYNIKSSNLKKTAILASKEAKRWQLRTNKGTKDLQARAKRTMREMMTFWKRNEREERDLRRAAEKQELDAARKAEADREANRQKRKLNFLISQTELYSHFIGKKIKTDEVERSTDHPDVAASENKVASAGPTINVPDSHGATGVKVTNFDQLDFDADDESALHAAAMANAQNAIQEAQDKARAFNKPKDDAGLMDDEGEMNFQNPTGIGDVDIEQPKLLSCQLKEYQLKGLNWLVNLYEQGINGILADEMGLGKTVQSISVMAYLAETHNIWGPFLVVAPASTLHNWQQEIAKFVPKFKVLPYWGTAGDRKVLRKFWDRKHIIYNEDAPFHVMITSYQLVVSDVAYFQKMRWQYMILDEAQAIKSSQSSRWKSLLGFHCRNRLLLTGTPIQNNMQELWALLHFIMPSLFDSHDEFSEWFSKDIESHAQSNTKLNEDQLKRLHMILKPFMLRRVKKHVQKELGDKIELDIFCNLTYRQRAYYSNLRNQISLMDLIEKATTGDESDTGTLMNLVMQFRKVCNHPDLFERADITSPFSFGSFAEAASFLREGPTVNVAYSTRNPIEYQLPRLVWREGGRLDLPGSDNSRAGFKGKYLDQLMNVWKPENVLESSKSDGAFSWLRFIDTSAAEASGAASKDVFARAVDVAAKPNRLAHYNVIYDEEDQENYVPAQSLLRIVERSNRRPLAEVTKEGYLNSLLNVSRDVFVNRGLNRVDPCGMPPASAPPIEVHCSSASTAIERSRTFFNSAMRKALYGPTEPEEKMLLENKVPLSRFPMSKMLSAPISEKRRFNNIAVPSMRRFVTDSGKLAKLDELLIKLKEEGHRVLLYFQMTRMIDLMEEYLTYRNYKYCRLDGSTKLEDRRDTVHDFQTRPEIFIFLLSTRAGGLGINLTSADTVIFYDSDWNPTIDSQAMDRAHRLGQTKQVTVYRMITRGTIEERIRKRALQKEEVQRVVISGGSGGGVDFNTRSRENRTKDIAMWLADDDQAAEIERKEAELAALDAKLEAQGIKKPRKTKKKSEAINLDDMYHEGEGHFDDNSNKPSGAATPVPAAEPSKKGRKKGVSKKAKTAKQRLAIADGQMETDF